MIRPLNPCHDRDPQLVPGGPPTAVENVLLQQSEERLHRSVIAGSTDPAHRFDDAVAGQGSNELLRPDWLPRSLCVTHPATSPPRRITAISRASTAKRAFILELIE